MTPSSRGIATSNIRLQPVQAIKMLSGNENPNLLQVLGNRRIQTVSVQKPQQNVQQQMTVEASVSGNQQQQQQGQMQTSPNPQAQPQNSPQQVTTI